MITIKPIGAAGKRQTRFKPGDFWLKVGEVGVGYIRRVGDDQIELPIDARIPIGKLKPHPSVEA